MLEARDLEKYFSTHPSVNGRTISPQALLGSQGQLVEIKQFIPPKKEERSIGSIPRLLKKLIRK